MLTSKFTNRGVSYLMRLMFIETDGTYRVSITQDKICSPEESYNLYSEKHDYPSYSEACSKFRSVYRWNNGKEPSLPPTYDFFQIVRIDPQNRVTRRR